MATKGPAVTLKGCFSATNCSILRDGSSRQRCTTSSCHTVRMYKLQYACGGINVRRTVRVILAKNPPQESFLQHRASSSEQRIHHTTMISCRYLQESTTSFSVMSIALSRTNTASWTSVGKKCSVVAAASPVSPLSDQEQMISTTGRYMR